MTTAVSTTPAMDALTDNSPSLPIIDYSKLVEVKTFNDPDHSLTRPNEQRKLFAALRDVGFVYLQNHSIPPKAQQLLFQHARQFFAQPESEKAKIETGESKAFHGWFSPQRTSGNSTRSDQKEAFDIGDDNDPTRPNQWLSDWPDFRTDMTSSLNSATKSTWSYCQRLPSRSDWNLTFSYPMFRRKTTFSVCSIILRRPARHSVTDLGPAPIPITARSPYFSTTLMVACRSGIKPAIMSTHLLCLVLLSSMVSLTFVLAAVRDQQYARHHSLRIWSSSPSRAKILASFISRHFWFFFPAVRSLG